MFASLSLGQRSCCHADLAASLDAFQIVCQYIHIRMYIYIHMSCLHGCIRIHVLTSVRRFSVLHSELEFLLRFVWRQRSVSPRVVFFLLKGLTLRRVMWKTSRENCRCMALSQVPSEHTSAIQKQASPEHAYAVHCHAHQLISVLDVIADVIAVEAQSVCEQMFATVEAVLGHMWCCACCA